MEFVYLIRRLPTVMEMLGGLKIFIFRPRTTWEQINSLKSHGHFCSECVYSRAVQTRSWRAAAEFSSNLPQHTCMEASSMPSKSLISCFRCVLIRVGSKLCRTLALQNLVWTALVYRIVLFFSSIVVKSNWGEKAIHIHCPNDFADRVVC